MWFATIGRRKRNDSDEDIEQVLAELALEYSGEKKSTDDKVESKTEPDEQKVDNEDKKKKGKKDKKKDQTEKNDIKDETTDNNIIESELNNADMDTEASTIKTAAQKKKEKKEREKQKKLAQKKAVRQIKCIIYSLCKCPLNEIYHIIFIIIGKYEGRQQERRWWNCSIGRK